MWCERVVRNLADAKEALGEQVIDYVDVEWDECKSVLKKHTRGGEPVRVLLPSAQRLRHGDVLLEEQNRAIVVNVLPAPMVVVRPPDATSLAILALELGNLHWPTQIAVGEVIFPPSEVALDALKRLGLPWTLEDRRFEPQTLVATNGVNVAAALQVIRGGKS